MKIITKPGILVTAALTLWIAATAPAPASLSLDSKPKEWPANPAKHQITIRRTAADETEKKMIAAAEAAKPAVSATGKQDPAATASPRWWHQEVMGTRIAYAVTAEAVAYYSALVEGYQKQVLTRFLEPASKFTYEASVSLRENHPLSGKTLPRVYVVKLKLSFSDSFVAGSTEAFQFTKEREVILDPNGKVLRITGDGKTEVPVMAI